MIPIFTVPRAGVAGIAGYGLVLTALAYVAQRTDEGVRTFIHRYWYSPDDLAHFAHEEFETAKVKRETADAILAIVERTPGLSGGDAQTLRRHAAIWRRHAEDYAKSGREFDERARARGWKPGTDAAKEDK